MKLNNRPLHNIFSTLFSIAKKHNELSEDSIKLIDEKLGDWEQTILSELDIIASSTVKNDDDKNTEESDSV
jgi:hypothetical protein